MRIIEEYEYGNAIHRHSFNLESYIYSLTNEHIIAFSHGKEIDLSKYALSNIYIDGVHYLNKNEEAYKKILAFIIKNDMGVE